MTLNLLLAEDDSISRLFLSEVLRDAGHRVCAVDNGQAALLACRDEDFDVLLLDLNLPDTQGDALLSAIRTQSGMRQQQAIAIALTADDSPTRRSQLLANGFTRVGHKPLTAQALLSLLDTDIAQPAPMLADAPAHWDDNAALSAAGGQMTIVTALRALFRQELPQQREQILDALADGRHDDALAVLHRLRAACGFCGAPWLAHCVQQLETAIHPGNRDDRQAAVAAFDAACQSVSA